MRALVAATVAVLTGCAAPVLAPRTLEMRAFAPQDPEAQDPKERDRAQEVQQWHPPAPDPDDFDWIKLVSGEWLKGELKYLRSDSMEFESDELDTVTLDWSDVAEVRSPHQITVALIGRRALTGTLLIREGVAVVGTAQGEERFPRAEVMSLVPGGDSWSLWSGKISIGVTTQSGNTNQTTMNSLISIRRRSAFSRLGFDYLGNFGKVDGVENVNNHRFTGRWDLFVSQDWFLTPISLDFFSDRFQNIQLQVTPAIGGGYHIFDTPDVEWDLTLAGGWRFTRFESVQAGAEDTDSTASVIPGMHVEWDITGDLEWIFDYSIEIGVPETSNTNQHLLTTLSIDLWSDFDLDITFQWDRVGDPQPDSGGVTPERDDYRTSIGIGWDF